MVGGKVLERGFPFHRKGRGGRKQFDVSLYVYNLKGGHAYCKDKQNVKSRDHH